MKIRLENMNHCSRSVFELTGSNKRRIIFSNQGRMGSSSQDQKHGIETKRIKVMATLTTPCIIQWASTLKMRTSVTHREGLITICHLVLARNQERAWMSFIRSLGIIKDQNNDNKIIWMKRKGGSRRISTIILHFKTDMTNILNQETPRWCQETSDEIAPFIIMKAQAPSKSQCFVPPNKRKTTQALGSVS